MRRIKLIPHKRPQQPGAGELDEPTMRHARRMLFLLTPLTLLALTFISLAATGAFAGASVPAPSITARPAEPTNQTAAHFTYPDSQAGASFECRLDGGSFASCPATGITYAGPLAQGTHSFAVRAVFAGKTSDTTTYSWTIDTLAPSVSVSSPVAGARLSASGWASRCSAGSICGEASDAHGVASVAVSIQRSGGGWWGGSAFDQPGESFRAATLSGGSSSPAWSYTLPMPADGQYTVHVRATDLAGNTTPAASQAVSVFTVDTTPPPAPTISSGPEASTTERSATFTFADGESAAALLCRRDESKFASCTSPQSYGPVSFGSHSFEVEAVDAAGNASAATSYSWTVANSVGGKEFTIGGDLSGPLAPGVARPLSLTITNPNSIAIEVTVLTVAIGSGSSKAGCDGPSNLQVTPSNVSTSNPLTVPANGHVTLPSGSVRAPEVLMRDLSTNQDPCKNATFAFTYTGSAHS
ncbi:MAG: large repetitive protein [Solirubrobacteraceae bacterium]|nr:large repetitive protein [Solirubrobacteraceae bacterium]